MNMPTPRDAATIVLIRDTENGIETFVQRRASTMAFAAGMTVFPGGGLNDGDTNPDLPWAGPEPRWWAEQFSVDEDIARGLVSAAVRETFEECGVLLAGTPDAIVADATAFASERDQLAAGQLSMTDFLQANDLVLRTDLLRPLSNWITPEGEKRRYDTKFFLAELPVSQRADGNTSEAAETGWFTPAALLESWRAGDTILMPPTWAQLRVIENIESVADALEVVHEIRPIMPSWVDGRLDFPNADAYLEGLPKTRG